MSIAEYAHLESILSALQIPYCLVMGNHDCRDSLREVFQDQAYLPSGPFIQYAVEGFLVRLVVLARELEAGDACEQEVRALPARVRVPLRLIVSSAPLGPDEPLPPGFPRAAYNHLWQEASAEMLALSADATLTRAERSDHLIQLREPELVEDVVRALLEYVRAHPWAEPGRPEGKVRR